MNKVVLMFPGQGSQFVGMGKELFERHESVRRLFARANEVLGYSLAEICFEGPEELLMQTANTQPAVLTVSVACWQLLEREGVVPDFVAGHSLGEYSALVAAGALQFEDAVLLVHNRGIFMEEAVPIGQGAMAAVLGMDNAVLEDICREVEGVVEAVNYNCPGQIVIAGSKEATTEVSRLALERGARKVIPLSVSGPFHSSLMQPAAERLGALLEKVTIAEPAVPVVANVTANYVATPEEIRQALLQQVDHPVRWQESVERTRDDGAGMFIEIGPGKVLSGLVKKIARESTLLNIEDQISLEKTLVSLKG